LFLTGIVPEDTTKQVVIFFAWSVTMIKKFLKSGEFYITNKPMILESLVGSCVSVCLYNVKNGSAAMNHFLRAHPVGDGAVDIGEFGNTSTKHMISKLMAVDDAPSHYKAMVFGGAAVVKVAGMDSDIGRNNVEVALKALAEARIRVVKKDVLGSRGRRIQFNTETGDVEYRFAGDIPRKSKPS
jgi:chemotaxis protein CheD